MHHPGPPRFVSTGETVQLAPRDPDPAGSYEWRIADAPPASDSTVGTDPVIEFTPDVPGRYRLGLDAPDGDHLLTVLAFSAAYEGVDVAGGSGEAIRDRDADRAGIDYAAGRLAADGGPPRIRLDAEIMEESGGRKGSAVVRAVATPNPASSLAADELAVRFVIDDRDVAAAVAAGRTNPRDAATVTEDRTTVTEDRTTVTEDGTGATLRLPTGSVPDRLRVHAVAVARESGEDARISVADAVSIDRVEPSGGTDPFGDPAPGEAFETSRLNQPPAWTADASVYEVFVRTFVDADEGETLAAIAERIPEIADLGVDTLWLTPVLENDGKPHGYNVTDFLAIADDLGDRGDYERLVETAHDNGMRVLFDLVLNHTARDHSWFRDAYRNPESPYRDRYEWQESGEPDTYFDWELIANLDHANLTVRRYLLDVVDEWAPLVDGFRCDMAWAVPDSLWREIRDRVKGTDPEFLLLDETIPYVPRFHEGMFDVHFDATLYFQLRQVGRGAAPADSVIDAVEKRAAVGFPDHAGFLQYIENHDETRYRVECGDDAAAAAAAATFTLPGVPMVYAGQEIGQRGRRDPIAWEHARGEVRERYARLSAAHDAHPALGPAGDLDRVDYHVAGGGPDERPIAADGEEVHPDDVVAFRRGSGSEALVVVLNFAPGEAAVDVDVDHGRLDVVTGDPCVEADEDGTDRIRVDDVAVVPLESSGRSSRGRNA
ncbi:alpha-amylase family glycosyl hydrolase [Halorubrum sp. F4]|uniref:alpha-amylase family glycosyl hydrolase n=1 Tax=Halorubrum sp. F4 TaxID=2989715 RepID=UPI00247FDDC5|nr:alpha-amylase family glycosyl hydrolase [Halorubrum sp. F4]